MVLGGRVNKGLVALIQQAGGQAVGLCGKDSEIIRARQMVEKDIGFVGEVTSVDSSLLRVSLWPEWGGGMGRAGCRPCLTSVDPSLLRVSLFLRVPSGGSAGGVGRGAGWAGGHTGWMRPPREMRLLPSSAAPRARRRRPPRPPPPPPPAPARRRLWLTATSLWWPLWLLTVTARV